MFDKNSALLHYSRNCFAYFGMVDKPILKDRVSMDEVKNIL